MPHCFMCLYHVTLFLNSLLEVYAFKGFILHITGLGWQEKHTGGLLLPFSGLQTSVNVAKGHTNTTKEWEGRRGGEEDFLNKSSNITDCKEFGKY